MKRVLWVILALVLSVSAFSGCRSSEDAYNDDRQIADSFDIRIATRYLQNYISQTDRIIIHAQAQYFSGVSGMCSIRIDSDTVCSIALNIKGGKLKVVLVRDKTVYKLFENSDVPLIDIASLSAGVYELKFVGQQAEFELDMVIISADISDN